MITLRETIFLLMISVTISPMHLYVLQEDHQRSKYVMIMAIDKVKMNHLIEETMTHVKGSVMIMAERIHTMKAL